jgi:hypothetical protein
MKFYMDTSNDSETEAYVAALTASVAHGTIATDARGHYTALAPYVLAPFTATLQRLTAGYVIRGFVFARLFVGLVLNAAAYAWYRRIGLGWLTCLVGLMVLSTSFGFALLMNGWELDKMIEPALFLVASVAAWNGRYRAVVPIAALAAANRETGVFVPLVAAAALARQHGELRSALTRWPVMACLGVCLAEVILFRLTGPPPPSVAWLLDLKLDRLVFVSGGLCLMPVLAVAFARAAPLDLRRLFLLIAPAWVALVLGIDRLDLGALLLTPLALVFVPVTLAGVERALQAPRQTTLPTPPA